MPRPLCIYKYLHISYSTYIRTLWNVPKQEEPWRNTWHTPETSQLTLDEEVLKAQGYHQTSTYWLTQNYFQQHYHGTLNAEDIHDASVPKLTCGKWRYEWVFNMEG